MSPEEVLIVSDNATLAWGVLRCLGDIGVRSVVMGAEPLPIYRYSRYCRGYAYCERNVFFEQPKALIQQIDDYCSKHRVSMLIPADLQSTLALAEYGDTLDAPLFPLPSAEQIRSLHDKWRFYLLLTRLGLPRPETRLIERIEDVDTFDLEFPVVTKPLNAENAAGIVRLNSKDEVRSYLAGDYFKNELPLTLQQFIPGMDMGISLLADHGKLKAWSMFEAGRGQGVRNFILDDTLLEYCRTIVEATEYHGVGHIDLRRNSNNGALQLFEFNPRFWGSLVLAMWTGVNFVDLGMRMARGDDPEKHFKPVEGLCVNPGIAVTTMIKTLLRGHWVPQDLSPASQAAWRFSHTDPVPILHEHLRRWSRKISKSKNPLDW